MGTSPRGLFETGKVSVKGPNKLEEDENGWMSGGGLGGNSTCFNQSFLFFFFLLMPPVIHLPVQGSVW